MPHNDPLTLEEMELEATLSCLRPAGPAIGRDAMVFRAGQTAALRQVRRWQAAAGTLGVLLAGCLALPFTRPVARTVYVERSVPAAVPSCSAEPDDTSHVPATRSALAYLSLRDDVLSRGVDALRSPVSHAASPSSESLRAFQPRHSGEQTGRVETFE